MRRTQTEKQILDLVYIRKVGWLLTVGPVSRLRKRPSWRKVRSWLAAAKKEKP